MGRSIGQTVVLEVPQRLVATDVFAKLPQTGVQHFQLQLHIFQFAAEGIQVQPIAEQAALSDQVLVAATSGRDLRFQFDQPSTDPREFGVAVGQPLGQGCVFGPAVVGRRS